jgi:hypothetical protein
MFRRRIGGVVVVVVVEDGLGEPVLLSWKD